MSVLQRGDTLGSGYTVEEVVGEGAMSSVYRVHDSAGVTWALKALDVASLAPEEVAEARALFMREARILSTLSDPCFPTLVDCFEERGGCFLVMEFLQGRTLAQVVESNGPCPESYVRPIACELARGLETLHRHPLGVIVFRDVKPGNVMLTDDGDVKLVDFGIARFHRPQATHDTQPLGTHGFAAPEQYGAAQTTPRSDLYSLGATLYFALTGTDPGVVGDQPPSVCDPAPACSPGLAALITRCLQREPGRRPESARDVLRDLEAIPASSTSLGLLPRRGTPSLGRRWWRAMFGNRREMGGFILVTLGAFLAVWLGFAARQLPEFPRPPQSLPILEEGTRKCCGNLRWLSASLDRYHWDNHDRYPRELGLLVRRVPWVDRIPRCPAAERDTYSAGYVVSQRLDRYTISCSGVNHRGQPADYPRYDSRDGLQVAPDPAP